MKIDSLEKTVELMTSTDYKERFLAEYYQLRIRRDKLASKLLKWDKGELNFVPTCPKVLLENQVLIMNRYIEILEDRAEIENIGLTRR